MPGRSTECDWLRVVAPGDETGVAHGVVRRPERPVLAPVFVPAFTGFLTQGDRAGGVAMVKWERRRERIK